MNITRLSCGWARSIAVAALAVLVVPSTLKAEAYIRGIYLSAYAARQEWLLKKIEEAADRGDLNAIVVDMKDDFGYLRYSSGNKIAQGLGAIRPVFDVDSLLDRMHAHNVRVIARLVCFKDYQAARFSSFGVVRSGGGLWQDEGGAYWLNPFSERTWEYIASIARELEEVGFDEIQLDYVRFPTDGDVLNCVFYGRGGRIKEEAIEGFLKLMRAGITVPLSVDVFGYAAWRTLKLEGQELARMAPYVDYICPMLYPSHFSPQFLKGDPDRDFWVYYESVESAFELMGETQTGVVTYVQGFSWRAPGFSPGYIFDQMLGSLAAGADGFFIWNASGKYLPSFEAFSWGGSSIREKDVPSHPEIHRKSTPHPEIYVPVSKTRTRNRGRN
jgi:hypothetical protein